MRRSVRAIIALAGATASSASSSETLAEGTSLAGLLTLRENSERSWSSDFEEWCKSELGKQNQQRAQLTHLRNDAAPIAEDASPEAFEAKRLEAMSEDLRSQHAAVAQANATTERLNLDIATEAKQVEALTAIEKDMVAQLSAQVSSQGQSQAASKLLKEAKDRLQKAEEQAKQQVAALPALESKRE